MNPFFFGESSRRLFGVYTPAQATGAKQRGIVLCHPWGQEYLRAHRSMRQLSNMLAGAGYHVLRFDYFGTGDSAGDMTQADFKGWQADVATAVEELKDTTGLSRVSLLGLRLGATLAAQVAVRRCRDVDALVLWDPVVAGGEYLEELRRTEELVLPRPVESGGGLEILGFPLTETLSREIETFDLVPLVGALPPRVFVALSQALRSHAALRPALGSDGGKLAMELIESQPAWLEDRGSGAGAVPVKVLQRIVEWLA